jgi:putative tricarboxylic transport membrane protein
VRSGPRPLVVISHGPPGSGPALMAAGLASAIAETDTGTEVRVEHLFESDGAQAILALSDAGGDGRVASTCTPTFFTTPIKQSLPVRYTDLTPLAGLVRATYLLVVSSGHAARDAKDLFGKPTRAACAPRGGNTHIQALCLAELTTSEVTPVFYSSVPAAAEALISGNADWTTGVLSDFEAHLQAGELRVLASLDEDDVLPTLTSQGIEFTFRLWRGLIGPPRLSADAVLGWVSRLEQASASPAWSSYLENAGVRSALTSPAEFAALLHKEGPQYAAWLARMELWWSSG